MKYFQGKKKAGHSKDILNREGITLIELLIALVIFSIIIAGIYNIFLAQSRTYVVQNQTAEIQHDIRSAMEIMVRDIRMAGYENHADENNPAMIHPQKGSDLNLTIFPGDQDYNVSSSAIRIEYRRNGSLTTVAYFLALDPVDQQIKLRRVEAINGVWGAAETLLDNVPNLPNGAPGLNFSYGVDGSQGPGPGSAPGYQDGSMDDRNNDGQLNNEDFAAAADVAFQLFPMVVFIELTAPPPNPNANPDIANITPRSLFTTVRARNLSMSYFTP